MILELFRKYLRPSKAFPMTKGGILLPAGTLVKGMFCSRVLFPDGTVDPRQDWREFPNMATTLGHNYLLNTGFRGTAASASWYMFLIAQAGFSALATGDTSASHAGWAEETQYSGSRPAWAPAAAASGAVAVASAVSFTASAAIDVRGAGIANSATKSSAVDLIYSTAAESSARSIASSGVYQAYYTVTLTPSS